MAGAGLQGEAPAQAQGRAGGSEDLATYLVRALGEARAAAAEMATAASRLAMVARYREGRAHTCAVEGWARGATAGRALELLREFYEVYRRSYPAVLAYAISVSALAKYYSPLPKLLKTLERRAKQFESAMAELEASGPDPGTACSRTEACEPVEKAVRKAVNVAFAAEDVVTASVEVVRRVSLLRR